MNSLQPQTITESSPLHLLYTLKARFEPFQNHSEAIRALVGVSAAFDHHQDPFSTILRDWCDDFIYLFENRNPASLEQFISLSGEELRKLEEFLNNPLAGEEVLTEKPLIDSDGWLWEHWIYQDYLDASSALGQPCISPFTLKSFSAQAHPFAEALANWMQAMPKEEFYSPVQNAAKETASAVQQVGIDALRTPTPMVEPNALIAREIVRQEIAGANMNPFTKLLLYRTRASKAKWMKQAKQSQKKLEEMNAQVRAITLSTQAMFLQSEERSRLNEQRRDAEVNQKLEIIQETFEGTVKVLNHQLNDTQKQLERERENVKQTEAAIEDLQQKVVLNGQEQEKLNALHENALEERIQGVEKTHEKTKESLQSQLGDVKLHNERVERRVQILTICTEQQEKTIERQNAQLTAQERRLYEQDARIAELARQGNKRPWWQIL